MESQKGSVDNSPKSVDRLWTNEDWDRATKEYDDAEAVYVGDYSVRDETWREFISARGVEIPCPYCGGLGVKTYPDTTTWRGGAGGQAITLDVCDHCWGSGDANKPWLNLRTVKMTVDAYLGEIEMLHKSNDALRAELERHLTPPVATERK